MPRSPGDDYQPRPVAPGRRGVPVPPPLQPFSPYFDPYDPSLDPTLQRIRARGQARIAEAQAEALRLRREAALEYGDEGLARELGLSDADIAAARDNPFSIRAKLAKARAEAPKQLDEDLNQQNLFYSGTRVARQSDLANSLLERESNAAGAIRSRLGDIQRGLTDTERDIEGENIGAEEDAAARLRDRLGDLQVGPRAGPAGAAPIAHRVAGRIHAPVPAARRAAARIRPPLNRRIRY